MKPAMLAMVLVWFGGASMADTWEQGENKGLTVYRAIGQGIEATMVCDPEKLMEPPEYHLTFKVGGQEKSGEYVVSAGDQVAKAHLDYGTAMDADLAAIVAVLQSSASVDVSVDGASYQLVTDKPFAGKCGPEI